MAASGPDARPHQLRSKRKRSQSGWAFFDIGDQRLLWSITAATTLLYVVVGGGAAPGRWSDAVAQLASLVLIGAAAYYLLDRGRMPNLPGPPLIFLGAAFVLPLLQLLKLPAAIWAALPGRETVTAAFTAAGMDLPWQPLSLNPGATWRSLLSLLPPCAVFLATLCLGMRGRRVLSLLFIAGAVVSVVISLAQVMGGPDSGLYLYDAGSAGGGVGFFANRNHYAALLYAMIPFTAAWLILGQDFEDRSKPLVGLVTFVAIYSVLMLGLGMARSRAGFLLGLFATLASLAIARSSPGSGKPKRTGLLLVLAASIFGLALVVQFGLFGILSRFEADPVGDARFAITGKTLQAIGAYMPFGSGFGTFQPIYQMFERPADIASVYINHAHDDWLEIVLEGGLPGVILEGVFLFWFVRKAIAVWRGATPSYAPLDVAIIRAATITIALLLLHSLVDYPLRTTMLTSVLAFCLALLIPPASRRGSSKLRSHRTRELELMGDDLDEDFN